MKKIILYALLFITFFQSAFAQVENARGFTVDSVHTTADDGIKTKLLPSMIVPAILIGYGITTIGNHGLYSSRQARTDLLTFTKGKGSHIDNILQFSPYAEFAGLLLLRVKCKNDVLNTALLIAKAEILMNLIVEPAKYIVKEERPYSWAKGQAGVSLADRKKDPQAFLSMPSGHTAEAFLAATIVYREYRYKSIWYGIGAYTLATSVALFRMINDQHWESDVLVGAGVGMLATNIVYSTHIHRWGRKAVCDVVPMFDGVNKGLAIGCVF